VRGVKLSFLSLTNRYQVVKINNEFSNELPIKYSVPQDTVLGPLLFTIYIKGLLNQNIDGEILCFADDTAIILFSGDYFEQC